MTRSTRVLLSVIAFAPLAAACGGGKPPTMEGREGMLSKTAIAQKCEEAAKGHDRPFVIEWDATDLASFEALAARDAVVVKYEGCDIQVLDHCSDASIPGKFGAYGAPLFTSGTEQGFDIGNQGELYAKLPLGAASLSGKVSAGENLHLKYFVSGVATSTRDALYSQDLAKVPGCAGATHFVWGYNLGAFELNSAAHNAEEAKAGFGNIGAGGSSGHQESSLANGGSLASCTTNDQRSCRVPIRLVLRAITDGASPAQDPMNQQTVVGGTKMTLNQMAATPGGGYSTSQDAEAQRVFGEAVKRQQQGDPKACVEMIDRAINMSSTVATQGRTTHALCQMEAGNCDLGKTEYRSILIAQDTNRTLSDDQLNSQVAEKANNECPSSTASTPAEFLSRSYREMTAYYNAQNGQRCSALADQIETKIKALGHTQQEMVAEGRGLSAMGLAADCVAVSKGCDAGAALTARANKIRMGNRVKVTPAMEQSWKDGYMTSVKQRAVKCN